MMPRIFVPGRTLEAGKASRHAVTFAGFKYLESLQRAGAIEMIVKPRALRDEAEAEALLDQAHGLLLLGGPDVDPALYGQEPHPRTYGVVRAEDEFEVLLTRAAVRMRYPTLAVCRGFQLVNVALGGTLDQHITDRPGTLSHSMASFPAPAAGAIGPILEIPLTEGCRLAEAIADETAKGAHARTVAMGAHAHHQAVDRVGEGLVVTGRTSDGIIEAFEHTDGWLVGVQWHPEDTAADDAAMQRLFDAFVAQARIYASVATTPPRSA